MKTVLTFGSFDHVHEGHLYYLKEAKKYGDFLVVVIARDETIEKIKEKKPKYDEDERLAHISELDFVDKVMLGRLDDPYRIVQEVSPEVIALGYDQNSFSQGLEEELKKRGLNSKIVRIKPYKEDIYKSSILKTNH